jgi:hypothetical protein
MGEGLAAQEDPVDPRRRAPGFASSFLILFALWSFAVAQPLFDVLSEGAVFFLAHRTSSAGVAAFALTVAVPFPLVLAILVELVRIMAPSAARGLAAFLHAALASLLVAGSIREWSASPWVVIGLALVLGSCAAFVLVRFSRVRQLTAWIGAASVVFPLLFLFDSSVQAIWLDGEAPEPDVKVEGEVEAGVSIPVIMVVFDEFPLVALMNAEEEIDAGRYPSFAALARTSTWFRNATSVAQTTNYAIPAMLTGRYPPEKRVLLPTHSAYPENLFSLVGRRFPVHATEWITSLCPESLCASDLADEGVRSKQVALLGDAAAVYLHRVTPGDWREALPPIDGTWRDFWSTSSDGAAETELIPARFGAFLDTLHGSPGPGLYFMHCQKPHLPWDRLQSGKLYRGWGLRPHGHRGGRWHGSDLQMRQAQRRLLLLVGFIDGLVGRLRADLEELGLWDEAMVIMTSDHGSAFALGSGRRVLGPGTDNLIEIANVPLFIKWPEQKVGRVDDSNVEIIDVLPTILDALGLPSPEGIDGVSLARAQPRRKAKRISMSWRMGKSSGGVLHYPPDTLEGRKEIVEATVDRFGSGGWESVYRMGPHSELIGRRVEELLDEAPAPEAVLQVAIDFREEFDDVDLDSLFVPVHVKGEVFAPATDPARKLAIAVDGRVRATTETWRGLGRTRFLGLLPEEALSSGRNLVEVYEIVESNGPARLRRLLFRAE